MIQISVYVSNKGTEMRFVNKTNKITIDAAIMEVDYLLKHDSPLMADLYAKTDWKFNSGSSADILITLLRKRDPIDIYYYKPLYPWSAALGYFDGEAIHINYKKMLSHKDVVGLLLHEYAHYCGYKHGNNYKSKEKCLYSVPYWLSENVKNYI